MLPFEAQLMLCCVRAHHTFAFHTSPHDSLVTETIAGAIHKALFPLVQSIGVLTSKCTVQPVAVRSSIDVFGENKRLVVEIDSPEFGTLVYVIIAAVQVGSITMTTKEGQAVSKVMPWTPNLRHICCMRVYIRVSNSFCTMANHSMPLFM